VRNKDQEYQKAFGRHIKQLREDRAWSQQQLAAVSNLEVSQISNIENGRHAANLHTIRTIAIALGRYPDELLRFKFDIKLNTDFQIQHRKGKRPETTRIVQELAETDFFTKARSVKDVITQGKKIYSVDLQSAPTSAVLKKLVDNKKLKRAKSQFKKTNFLYEKRSK
jgi:transcriptional regulator with XRE-family HTH domain